METGDSYTDILFDTRDRAPTRGEATRSETRNSLVVQT